MKNELKKTALVSEDREALRKGVSDVQAALDELMGALDFKYLLAGQLYPLYSYCKRPLFYFFKPH